MAARKRAFPIIERTATLIVLAGLSVLLFVARRLLPGPEATRGITVPWEPIVFTVQSLFFAVAPLLLWKWTSRDRSLPV
jgi:hypothetical protein